MRHFSLWSAACAVLPGSASAESAPVTASGATAGRWSIDYGERYCSLTRSPADRATPTLVFRLIPGHAVPEMLLLGTDWVREPPHRIMPVDVVLSPGDRRMGVSAVPIGLSGAKMRGFIADGLALSLFDDMKTADVVTVEAGRQVIATVPVPGAKAGIAALRECNDKLLEAWGIDLKEKASLRAEALPVTPVASLFGPSAYPIGAVISGTSGTVIIRFTVGTDGSVHDCGVVGSSGSKILDDQTCRVAERARYTPAIGSTGQPTADKVVMTVNWVAPRGS